MALPLLVLILFIFFFAAAAISPAFIMLQGAWGVSSFDMTTAFASYSLALLASLLVFGPSSDFIGRKPVLIAALSIQSYAMVLFCFMDAIAALITARTIQGIATGIANGALAAAILDHTPPKHRHRGALLTGITPLAGLAAGALVSGLVVQYVEHPIKQLFGSLAVITLITLILLLFISESVSKRPGVLRSMIPNLSISKTARPVIWRCAPVLITTWSIGCIYLTLVPLIFHDLFMIHDDVTTGLTIALLYFPACVSSIFFKSWSTYKVFIAALTFLLAGVLLMLIAEGFQVIEFFYLSTIITGIGFGGGFSNSLKEVGLHVDSRERAAAYALIFIISYLALALPALIAGYSADQAGIRTTILAFDGILILTAVTGIALQLRSLTVAERI